MFRDDQVAGSWAGLAERISLRGKLGEWGATEPVFTGSCSLDDLLAATRGGADRAHADRVLGALVRLAAADGGDDEDALLLLLHLLSDGAASLTRYAPGHGHEAMSFVVAQLTLTIRGFPWRRRTRAYAANLLRDTKAQLLEEFVPRRQRQAGVEVVLVDPLAPGGPWASLRTSPLTTGTSSSRICSSGRREPVWPPRATWRCCSSWNDDASTATPPGCELRRSAESTNGHCGAGGHARWTRCEPPARATCGKCHDGFRASGCQRPAAGTSTSMAPTSPRCPPRRGGAPFGPTKRQRHSPPQPRALPSPAPARLKGSTTLCRRAAGGPEGGEQRCRSERG